MLYDISEEEEQDFGERNPNGGHSQNSKRGILTRGYTNFIRKQKRHPQAIGANGPRRVTKRGSGGSFTSKVNSLSGRWNGGQCQHNCKEVIEKNERTMSEMLKAINALAKEVKELKEAAEN